MSYKSIEEMDKDADRLIKNWSFGSLAANLLPPPFDMIVVSGAFAKMGYDLSKVYEVDMSMDELKSMGKSIAKGILGVNFASFVGTSIFKWIPGVNIWVALFVQPPIVAAIAYSVGNTFKNYYHFHITKGTDLSNEELKRLAENTLREKVGHL